MRHGQTILFAIALGLHAPAAMAGDKVRSSGHASGTQIVTSKDIVATSNLFGDATDFSDIGVHLRGALSHVEDTEIGALSVSAAFDQTHYRTHDFAGRDSVHVAVAHQSDTGAPVSFETAASYDFADEGDVLSLQNIQLATRAVTQSFGASQSVRVRLPGEFIASWSVSERYDDVGKTRFDDALPDTKLTPDRNALRTSFGLATARAGLAYGFAADFGRTTYPQPGPLISNVSFRDAALRGRLTVADVGGWRLNGNFGMRRLRDDLGLFDAARPVYGLSVEHTFAGRLALKGVLARDFDTVDTDDPLATYRRRLDIEAVLALSRAAKIAGGLFAARGENLLLGNRERQWGLYGAVAYQPVTQWSLTFRVDYEARHQTVINLDDRTLSARLSLETRL